MNTPVPETEPFSDTVRIHILHKDATDSTKPLGVSECQDTSAHSVDGPGGSDACGLGDSISPVEGTTKAVPQSWNKRKRNAGPDTDADQKSIAHAEVSQIIHAGIAPGQVEHDSTPPMWALATGNSHNLYPSPGDSAKLYHCQSLPEPRPPPHTHTFATAASPFMQEHPQAF